MSQAPWSVETFEDSTKRFDRIVEIERDARQDGVQVVIFPLSDSRIMWRRLADGEQPMDRDPALDGIANTRSSSPRRNRRRGESVYPWGEWTDGEWHMAVQGRDYTCTTAGFMSVLRVKASQKNFSTSVAKVYASPESAYSTKNDVVFFIFLPFGERRSSFEAEQKFWPHKRHHTGKDL